MDLKKTTVTFTGGVWTEERHASFLNSMEESFVRTMLGDFDRIAAIAGRRRPRLDRLLPDSATESTRAGAVAGREHGNSVVPPHNRTRNRSPRLFDASDDQVVPQL